MIQLLHEWGIEQLDLSEELHDRALGWSDMKSCAWSELLRLADRSPERCCLVRLTARFGEAGESVSARLCPQLSCMAGPTKRVPVPVCDHHVELWLNIEAPTLVLQLYGLAPVRVAGCAASDGRPGVVLLYMLGEDDVESWIAVGDELMIFADALAVRGHAALSRQVRVAAGFEPEQVQAEQLALPLA